MTERVLHSFGFSSGEEDDADDDFSSEDTPGWVKRGRWANRRRTIEAERRILTAIAQLHNTGQPITYRAVRSKAGGSYRTITRVMRRWRSFNAIPWLPTEIVTRDWSVCIRQSYKG